MRLINTKYNENRVSNDSAFSDLFCPFSDVGQWVRLSFGLVIILSGSHYLVIPFNTINPKANLGFFKSYLVIA
jgi:hypothetical protein